MQSIVRNSGFNLPSDDLFGFERARRKFLLPLTTHVSLESDDLMDHDLQSLSEGDIDSGMCVHSSIVAIFFECVHVCLFNSTTLGHSLISRMNHPRYV